MSELIERLESGMQPVSRKAREGETCWDVDGAEELMHEAAAAIRDLEQQLAERQTVTDVDAILEKIEQIIEKGSPPGDCWIRKNVTMSNIRAALQGEKE